MKKADMPTPRYGLSTCTVKMGIFMLLVELTEEEFSSRLLKYMTLDSEKKALKQKGNCRQHGDRKNRIGKSFSKINNI